MYATETDMFVVLALPTNVVGPNRVHPQIGVVPCLL